MPISINCQFEKDVGPRDGFKFTLHYNVEGGTKTRPLDNTAINGSRIRKYIATTLTSSSFHLLVDLTIRESSVGASIPTFQILLSFFVNIQIKTYTVTYLHCTYILHSCIHIYMIHAHLLASKHIMCTYKHTYITCMFVCCSQPADDLAGHVTQMAERQTWASWCHSSSTTMTSTGEHGSTTIGNWIRNARFLGTTKWNMHHATHFFHSSVKEVHVYASS